MLLLVPVLFFIPSLAHGEGGEGGGEAVALGWVAIGAGLVANLSFVIFKAVRKVPMLRAAGQGGTVGSLAPMYSPMLNFHIMLNSVAYFAGMAHGLMLVRGLDPISLSLVLVMTVSMASGIILKYTQGRNMKLFGRLVHGQFVLAVLLVALVALHVITHSGGPD